MRTAPCANLRCVARVVLLAGETPGRLCPRCLEAGQTTRAPRVVPPPKLPSPPLTPAQIQWARELLAQGQTRRAVAKELGVHQSRITALATGRTFRGYYPEAA